MRLIQGAETEVSCHGGVLTLDLGQPRDGHSSNRSLGVCLLLDKGNRRLVEDEGVG